MILNRENKEKLNEYYQRKLGMYDYRRGWLKGDCPSCGEHKFGIHIADNRSHCFKCEYTKDPISLLFELEKIKSYQEFYSILSNLEGIKYTEIEQEAYEIKKDNVLPEGYKNIARGDSKMARAARRYLEKRGFDIKELSYAGFGYCNSGDYFGYIIMPIYYGNTLVYFNARLYIGDGPKFNNPDIENFGIGKSFIMYNRDALYIYDKVFIVESITNSRTLGDTAVGTMGKALSQQQINDIIKSPCKKIVIGLDRDAISQAIDIAYKLIDHKKVKIMIMPEGKDINDLGRQKSLLISHKAHYLTYETLRKLKNKYIDE